MLQQIRAVLCTILFFTILKGQSLLTIDTILVEPGQSNVQLKPFIIDSTFYLFHDGKLVEDYHLNTISGELELLEQISNQRMYHASYQYLNSPIPIQIGPIYESLPNLESLLIVEKDTSKITLSKKMSFQQDDKSSLATTGSVYRNLTLSPLGGSDFSGGLQLQLQGKLSNDITVSGVLSDQSLPIQPEGTTQTLEEIDKVYLHVSHPIFEIMAGDIEYNINSGKYLNVNRKLEGIKNTFHYEQWSGQSTLAGTKGRYHKLSFKGTDGSQGPYALTSENGNKDIIVLAGTEKVHLDGDLLKRGENFDYIIDYSIGEITFTPRRLIDFDSDIYIEYQYSDFQYNRNVMSASVYRELGDWCKLGISWFKEMDQLQIDETFAVGLRDSISKAGDQDAIISGVIEDDKGDYLLIDGIYVYSPKTINEVDNRYKVSFQNDNENGEYARKISSDGHLYFQFVDIDERSNLNDLYSPFRKWSNPVNHEIFQLTGNALMSKYTTADWDISLSNLDKNTFSTLNDNDNVGVAHNIAINGSEIPVFNKALIGYNFTNWRRTDQFREISRERNAQFNREWNLKSTDISQESLISSGINLKIDQTLNSRIDWSQYNSNKGIRNRLTGQINNTTKYIPKIDAYMNRVTAKESIFYQYNFNGMFLPGNFHPIISYKGESETGAHKFDVSKLGFLYSKENQSIAASISRRIDLKVDEVDSTEMNIIQDGIFGELDLNGSLKSGWSGKIVFKKRISDNFIKNEKLDYAIGLANLRFNNKTNPIRWELHSKLEETYTEARAVVYDSVGVGLGSYRYDKEFNEYISDLNGAYISHTILTGERELVTNFVASQRLFIDFAKSSLTFFKNFDLRSDFRTEFKGNSFEIKSITSPNLNDSEIAQSKINLRNEIDYNPQGSSRRIRNWSIYSQDLFGADPRGNDLRSEIEYGIEWREPVGDEVHSTINIEKHAIENSSGFSNLRNRKIDGWWIEEEIKWNIERKWQFSIATLGGKDTGTHNQESFSAYAYGIKFESQRFISSVSRIKVRTELFNSIESNDKSVIPPESLNGLPLGQSISVNVQGQVLLGKNLSINLNASYIDNSRYSDFITLSGELRAYF